MGEIGSALYYTQVVLDIAKEEGLRRMESSALLTLSFISLSHQQNFSQAQESLQRAIPILIEFDQQRNLWIAYLNLSLALIQQGKVEEALHYTQKSNEIAATLGLPQIAMATYYTHRGLIYLEESNYRNSLAMFYRTLELRVLTQDVGLIAEVKNAIGLAHSRMGNFDQALSYTNEALSVAQENAIARLEAAVQRNLADIHAARGDMSSFRAAMEAEETLRNQLFAEESNRLLHEMQVRYETEQKQLIIAQQRIDFQRQRTIVVLLLLVIISIVVISMLVVFAQRNKMRNVTQIVQQYERLLGYEKRENIAKLPNSNGVTNKLSGDLQRLFEVEKIYRKPRLSVDDVAQQLGIGSDRLSIILNQEYQKPFSDFVNGYRIAEARDILKDQDAGGEYAHYTVQAIAETVGFGSASSFYSAFRQVVGVTPTEYKDAIRKMKGKGGL
jgi:AraC-like DNA-binding protein